MAEIRLGGKRRSQHANGPSHHTKLPGIVNKYFPLGRSVAVFGYLLLEWPGLANFVPAVAYHFCLKFSQPGNGILAQPCTSGARIFLGEN